MNGSISATLGRTDWTGSAEFKSVNGSVTVAVPAGPCRRARASTYEREGRLERAGALRSSTRVTRREVTGTPGRGGRELILRTVNGSVRLRSAS